MACRLHALRTRRRTCRVGPAMSTQFNKPMNSRMIIGPRVCTGCSSAMNLRFGWDVGEGRRRDSAAERMAERRKQAERPSQAPNGSGARLRECSAVTSARGGRRGGPERSEHRHHRQAKRALVTVVPTVAEFPRSFHYKSREQHHLVGGCGVSHSDVQKEQSGRVAYGSLLPGRLRSVLLWLRAV